MKKLFTSLILLLAIALYYSCKKQAVDTTSGQNPTEPKVDTSKNNGYNCDRCNQELIGTYKVEAVYNKYDRIGMYHYFYALNYPKWGIIICDSTKLKGVKLVPTTIKDSVIYVMDLKLRRYCQPPPDAIGSVPFPFNAEVISITVKK